MENNIKVFNTYEDVASTKIHEKLFSKETHDFCLNVGLNFDKTFGLSEGFDSYTISNWSYLFRTPMVEENGKIIELVYKIQYSFNRLKNNEIKSTQILSVDLKVENDSVVEAAVWLPGKTKVNPELFAQLSVDVWNTGTKKLEKLNISKEDQDLELFNTEISFEDNNGWKENWTFVDLKSRKTITIQLEFNIANNGIDYKVFS